MRTPRSSESGCERARVWASLELDGHLSEMERALLNAHLRGCSACAAFVEQVSALSDMLRAAPPEQPGLAFAFPVRRPLLPNRRLGAQVALAAALAGLAAGLGVLVGPLTRGSDEPAPPLREDVVLVTPASANQLGREHRRVERHGTTRPEHRLFPPRRVRGNL